MYEDEEMMKKKINEGDKIKTHHKYLNRQLSYFDFKSSHKIF